MAENKNGFMMYVHQKGVFDKLTDTEAGKLIKLIFSYVSDENPQVSNRILDMAFEPIKQQLKIDLKKYHAKCDKNKENIAKRWNKPDTTVYDGNGSYTKNTDKDNDNGKDKDNGNDKDLWTQTKRDFFNDFIWYEDFCRKKNLTPNEMKRQMQAFIDDLELAGDVKELKDLKSHFLHSFNKGKYSKENAPVKKEKSNYDIIQKQLNG